MGCLDATSERIRFFEGRLLSADDLTAEQVYFRQKNRRHNRTLHGSGVVCGLEVSLGESELRVSPGIALDCAGNDVLLSEPETVALPEGGLPKLVALKYAEEFLAPEPVPGLEGTEAARIRECAEIVFLAEDPYREHSRHGCQRWTACGRDHPVSIARLLERRGGLCVERHSADRPGWLLRLIRALCSVIR